MIIKSILHVIYVKFTLMTSKFFLLLKIRQILIKFTSILLCLLFLSITTIRKSGARIIVYYKTFTTNNNNNNNYNNNNHKQQK